MTARFSSLTLAIAVAAGSARAEVSGPDPRIEWVFDIELAKPVPREQILQTLHPLEESGVIVRVRRKDGRWTFPIVGDTPSMVKRVVATKLFARGETAATYAAHLATFERAVAPLHGKVTPHRSPDEASAASTRILDAVGRPFGC